MTEWKTMRVPKDAWEAANEARGDNETWGEYLRRCADEPRIEMSEDELRVLIRDEVHDLVIDEALR